MFNFVRSKSFRDNAAQVGFVVGLLALIIICFFTARHNLEAQGLTSGFGFLGRSTGWGVSFSLIQFNTSDTYLKVIWVGILNSLFLGAISLSFATVIGIAIGIMRISGNRMAELIGTTFVEIFRNLPLLLQVFFWYAILTSLPQPRTAIEIGGIAYFSSRGIYLPGLNVMGYSAFLVVAGLGLCLGLWFWLTTSRRFHSLMAERKKFMIRLIWITWLVATIIILWISRIPETNLFSIPYLRGLNFREGIRVSPELLACIIGISIYGSAYIGEIVRAGLNSVPKGQWEAGHALGLTSWQIFSRIRLPLAIRFVMPTLINQYVWLFKSTTIGIAIGFVDFFFVISTSISQAGQTLELIAILMGGFLVINYSMSWVLNCVNDVIKLKGSQLLS